jgi:ABC-type transport system substrate-binding protein
LIILPVLAAETVAILFAQEHQEQKYFFSLHLALRAPFKEEYTDLLPQEFAKIGIELIPEPLEGAQWSQRYSWDGATWDEGGPDLIQCIHGWQRFDPRIGFDHYFSTLGDINEENPIDSTTHYYFANGFVDQFINRAYGTTDIEEAQKWLWAADEIIHEESPLLFIYWPKDVVVLDSDIMGYEPRMDGGQRLAEMQDITIDGKTRADDTSLTIAQASDAASVSPMTIGDTYSFQIQGLCYDSLITLDNDYKPTPGLAKSWEVSDDGKVITLHLEEDVLWHDGAEFTSEDVKWTYEMVLSSEEPTVHYHFHYIVMMELLEKIETPDENTVVFTFEEPHGTFFVDAGKIKIMAKHRWEGVDRTDIPEHEYCTDGPAMGTGPYIMTEWEKGQYMRFIANENYYKGTPFVDEIFLRFIPEKAAAIAALQAGEVNMLQEPYRFGKELEAVEGDPDIKKIEYESGYVEPLGINCNHPNLANKYVRQALNYVIPREHIVTDLRLGMGTPANQLCPPWNWGHNPNIPEYEYDIEKAKELMAKAGYDMSYLEPPEELTIPMSTYIMSGGLGLIIGLVLAIAYMQLKGKNI